MSPVRCEISPQRKLATSLRLENQHSSMNISNSHRRCVGSMTVRITWRRLIACTWADMAGMVVITCVMAVYCRRREQSTNAIATNANTLLLPYERLHNI